MLARRKCGVGAAAGRLQRVNVLILGGGGREHALAWKIAQSPLCDRLVVAPGNAGIAAIAEMQPLAIEDPTAVVAFCRDQKIDFVVVGPEAPLAAGVVDALLDAGIAAFGPRQAAAELETSKLFTKQVCSASGAPTADWTSFDRPDTAKVHVMTSGAPIVVKADGLAAGKGVTVAQTVGQAMAAIDEIFAKGVGARAGQSPIVIIEEAMVGEEASLFVLTDGENLLPFGAAQDHKRAEEGDKGPNTGGMGAFAPARVLSPELERMAIETIVRPTLKTMAAQGTPYRGVLYAGLMITRGKNGAPTPRLVEFNARFGDPETQVLLPRLKSDLLPVLLACAEPIGAARGYARSRKPLSDAPLSWTPESAVTVVMAAKGYPGSYARGEAIGGLTEAAAIPDALIFHAGTTAANGGVLSAGGRVLNVTGLGVDLTAARERAYAALDEVRWPGGFFRRDIGGRAAEAEARERDAAAEAAERKRVEAERAAKERETARQQAAAEEDARRHAANTGRDGETAPKSATSAAASASPTPASAAATPVSPSQTDARRTVTDAVVLDPWSDDGADDPSRKPPKPDGA